MEDLQIRGSSLKRIVKPSDDPIGNIDVLTIRSRKQDTHQYKRNISYAVTHLEFTENALSDLADLAVKAKDLAITQASDIYNPAIRRTVAKEIRQLKNQALAVGNRRIGNKYIFGGFKTVSTPFDQQGNYLGDNGHTFVEVSKDFFIPINLTGHEVFSGVAGSKDLEEDPLADLKSDPSFDDKLKNEARAEEFTSENKIITPTDDPELIPDQVQPNEQVEENTDRKFVPTVKRSVASIKGKNFVDQLRTLETALNTNNPDVVQELLEELDDTIDRFITLRTKIGSMINSIKTAELSMEKGELLDDAQKSKLEDADVAKLFSDLSRERNILTATYKTGAEMLNTSLVNFLR